MLTLILSNGEGLSMAARGWGPRSTVTIAAFQGTLRVFFFNTGFCQRGECQRGERKSWEMTEDGENQRDE